MKELKHRFSSGFFIVLALALLIFGSNNTSLVNAARGQVTDFFVPILSVASRPLQAVDDFIGWTQQVAIVFSENKRLLAENAQLKQARITSSQLAIDNQRLKRLLNVGEGQVNIIAAARVVSDSDSPFFKSVLINRGTDDGVLKGQAVINEDGIVGRIINAGSSSSRVLLATDINSHIPIKLASSGINMILEGDNSPYPKLGFLPLGEEISVGDLILTSGYGMVFPPDLPVGQVLEITEEGIKIKLSTKLYNLNYVSIVGYEIIRSPVSRPVSRMGDHSPKGKK
ncbi:MAG: rod shape-determining protein MreC [Alphaproteobacteria bacterium]|nr:MAG: rod shape-determining protein MreC [Alphaproteobacteria bacterium]